MAAHGSTWNVVELQAFLKFSKDWGNTILGLILLAALLISATYLAYFSYPAAPTLQISDIRSLKTNIVTSPQHKIIITKPTRLLLPSVNLAVDIDDATIDIKKNDWPLSSTNAQYANFTPGLGSKKGTMLIYGHNTWQVMRKTNDLKVGDILTLIDTNGRAWRFIMTNEENITPENVGFIYEDVPFRVVVFTCNGFYDQYRRLMYFSPVS